MLKKVLIGLALVFGVVKAKADTGVYDVLNDSITTHMVTVSSFTGTQLLSASLVGNATSFLNLLENREAIEIQNTDVSASIYCRFKLSSTSANGDLSLVPPTTLSTTSGRKILPGGSWDVNLAARDLTGRVIIPWCINNGGTGTTQVALTQGRKK